MTRVRITRGYPRANPWKARAVRVRVVLVLVSHGYSASTGSMFEVDEFARVHEGHMIFYIEGRK